MNAPVRVLVADDNEDQLFLTIRALRDVEGVSIEVEAVREGVEALDFVYRRGDYANRPRPHLILLDLKMPKMDGLEVLERLKGDPELRSIPVVVLTSSERPEDVDATYRVGGNSYIAKPSNVGWFRSSMRDLSDYWMTLASLPEPPTG